MRLEIDDLDNFVSTETTAAGTPYVAIWSAEGQRVRFFNGNKDRCERFVADLQEALRTWEVTDVPTA